MEMNRIVIIQMMAKVNLIKPVFFVIFIYLFLDDDDSDSESSDTEDKQSQYGLEIAELTNEISIKQKLIDELERSQQRMFAMKQHYEDKLKQLQDRIKATQEERDKVLASFSSQQNQPTDKVCI